jgi:hypothetical protein
VTLLAMTFFKQLNQLRRPGNQPVSHIYQASLPSSLAFSAVLHTITACTASPCPLHITSLSHLPAIARELDSLQCAALQALASIQEGGQVVEVDLPPVPRQASPSSMHTFEHRTGQRRVGFLPQVDRQQLNLSVPVPTTWE